jgi:hypothetical protein
MIEPAFKHEARLKELQAVSDNSWYSYNVPLDIITQRLVSTYNGEVIGSFNMVINRAADAILEFSVRSFMEKYRYYFAKDIMIFLRYLSHKYRKANFFVLLGSPEEKSYDRLIKIFGAKIIGIMEKQVKNIKGEWSDIKYYEWVNPNWRSGNNERHRL